MGMYNEVFKNCPKCGGVCKVKIPQITLGFGGFNLDDLDSLAKDLDESELQQLHTVVKDYKFFCQYDKCGHSFYLEETQNRRLALARKLFGGVTYVEKDAD